MSDPALLIGLADRPASPAQPAPPSRPDQAVLEAAIARLTALIDAPLRPLVGIEARALADGRLALTLAADCRARFAPADDTLDIVARFRDAGLPTPTLATEILIALLATPIALTWPTLDELEAAIRLRVRTATIGRHTRLHFATQGIERPWDHWTWHEENGFLLREDRALGPALTAALEPPAGHPGYAFSCYRAGEYVLLAALAHELESANPDLLAELTRRWQQRAIQSGPFHDVFLREIGSVDVPLPMRWLVPGDRVWFRNPDPASSDVDGYEGSWVVYLGRGEFANFWKPDSPFTLETKCVEVFHWRHAVAVDADGQPTIDEAIVSARVAQTLSDPEATAAVLHRMMRYRDPRGVQADGGCIDSTREGLRWILPGTTDIVVPPA